MKTCTECGEYKPLGAFYWRKDQQRYVGKCRDCVSVRNAASTRRRVARCSGEPREQICPSCYGLPHRVEGRRCTGKLPSGSICGLEHEPLFIPTIDHIMVRERFGVEG